MKKWIFNFPLLLFTLFTGCLLVNGVFFWDGGNTAYQNTGTWVRGLQMAGTVLLCLLIVVWVKQKIVRLTEKRLCQVTCVCAVLLFLGQFVFVTVAEVGIRYDSLKVVEEAITLFHQKGIKAGDLDGYFARYSNNYAITIFTHWLLKIFKGIGLLHEDFSNGVLLLQYCNILLVDAAFAGMWAFLKKYRGTCTAAIFVVYTLLNPLSYVWLPFYYTNTVAMPFAVWGMYFMFAAWDGLAQMREGKNGDKIVHLLLGQCMLAGILFAVGFKIRATVGIVLIAAVMTLLVRHCRKRKRGVSWKLKGKEAAAVLVLVFTVALTGVIYHCVENHYLAFDRTDTEFPVTHWIAMGLSDTGTFSPRDEAYTSSFHTAREKKSATLELIRKRALEHGVVGVGKLYMKKLALTFGDGAGGYHSELNISQDYGILWQIVYGVYRDPLLWITQCWYLVSVLSGFGIVLLLWKRKVPGTLYVLPLALLGSYLFQMLWEAGTIYSIGTMYLNGAVTAVWVSAWQEKASRERQKLFREGGAVGLLCLLSAAFHFADTDYVDVSMSVDQFLYQSEEYIALTEGEEIIQTFSTDKYFSTIALQAHNPEGASNDSIYSVALHDGQGRQMEQQLLEACKVEDYTFYPMSFHSLGYPGDAVSRRSHKYEGGKRDYILKIRKVSGENSLVFLYYNTGNHDAYKSGYMTGLNVSDRADLVFRVYWREESREN